MPANSESISELIHWWKQLNNPTRCQWLTPVILATQEAEIRRIAVWSLPGQIVCETLSQKKSLHKKRAGGVAWDVGPEFKPQCWKKKKKAKKKIQ
jgi:hypothetical protein